MLCLFVASVAVGLLFVGVLATCSVQLTMLLTVLGAS
jgi:hypothetical protein